MDMSTKSAVSIDEYLRTSYEDLDREYVDGEVVERSLPTNPHSKAQGRVVGIFEVLSETRPLYTRVELRSRVSATRVRIPDVSVYAYVEPTGPVPAIPPIIAIEIVSPDDRQTALIAKLEDYRVWGVQHLWLVDPQKRKLQIYENRALQDVIAFEIPEFDIRIPSKRVFR
jgi:Uma2 family endonuclease